MKRRIYRIIQNKRLLLGLTVEFLSCFLLLSCIPKVSAEIQVSAISSSSFMGNDVDSKGVLWAGDKNFGLYKSTDNGVSFQQVYKMAGIVENFYGGLVWTVFVDSRDYIFVSAGGTGGLFRSTDRGATFTQVLRTNGTSTESFYISMTEDSSGSLYAATYTNGKAIPYLLKSVDGGANWVRIGNFGVFHFHTVKFNPYNGYLYVIMGEGTNADAARILRSKDGGASWSLVVKRNDNVGTVYLAMTFSENYVYVGQDFPNRVCNIQRFYDDGSSNTFDTTTVYTPPSDGYMPFVTATNLGDSMVFSNCAELSNGVSRVVASSDGVNWNVLKTQNVTSVDNRWNYLTVHARSGIAFATIKPADSYKLTYIAPPPPTPAPTIYQPIINTPAPTIAPITPAPTPSPSPSPTPALTESPTNPATPSSTLAQTSTFRIDPYVAGILTVAVVMASVVATTVLLKHKQRNHN